MSSSPLLADLVEALRCLPGVGAKTAQRMAFHVLERDRTGALSNTTIAIVATDAVLSKAQAKRLAVAAQDGIARAASPSHTPVDGDLVFAVATGVQPLADPVTDAIRLGHAAATCLARAMARAIYLATPAPGDLVPTWRERWGRAR